MSSAEQLCEEVPGMAPTANGGGVVGADRKSARETPSPTPARVATQEIEWFFCFKVKKSK